MKIRELYSWQVTPKEAVQIQHKLRDQVINEDQLPTVTHVAGVYVGFEKNKSITRAAIAVLRFPDLKLVDTAIARLPTRFPYVPGLLSFREIPAMLKAMELLTIIPNLVLCDGQGIAHPRRFGIASHFGVLCDIPTIGVGKTRLIGSHDVVANVHGAWTPLIDRGETIGAVLRSKVNVNPLFISIGHRISLDTAIHYVLACLTKYRLPETTRWAHRLASG